MAKWIWDANKNDIVKVSENEPTQPPTDENEPIQPPNGGRRNQRAEKGTQEE